MKSTTSRTPLVTTHLPHLRIHFAIEILVAFFLPGCQFLPRRHLDPHPMPPGTHYLLHAEIHRWVCLQARPCATWGSLHLKRARDSLVCDPPHRTPCRSTCSLAFRVFRYSPGSPLALSRENFCAPSVRVPPPVPAVHSSQTWSRLGHMGPTTPGLLPLHAPTHGPAVI